MKKVMGFAIGIVLVIAAGAAGYFYVAYPDVPPAPHITVKETTAQVIRGKYLADHVAMCMDCHSTRDFSKFSGPIVAGTFGKGGEKFGKKMGFPGTFYAKNITPYGLRGWTNGDIYRAITEGVTKNGSALFPVMPYPHFNHMDPRDVKAIIAYLRTLKPIDFQSPKSKADFPVNFIKRTMPKAYRNPKRPPVSNIVKYGKYLITVGSCSDCHTPRKNGQPIKKLYMAGGAAFELPDGTVRSANLTPDKQTGIGNWTADQFVAYFKQFDVPPDSLPSPSQMGFNTVMPWYAYSGMKKRDLKAIFAYLQTLKPVKHKIRKYTPAERPGSKRSDLKN